MGEINGRYSRLGLPVIHYLYQSLQFDELIVALYRAGDVMLVTPFRDGMNLVAKEYAAAHIDGDGVLVLSEFAGAAEELTDAVLVNPHDDRALQQAIRHAVEMHRHERRQRMAGLRDQIRKRDVRGWAAEYMEALDAAGTGRPRNTVHVPTATTATSRRRAIPPHFDDAAALADHVAELLDRCSSGSTSTACSHRSSPIPTTRILTVGLRDRSHRSRPAPASGWR